MVREDAIKLLLLGSWDSNGKKEDNRPEFQREEISYITQRKEDPHQFPG